MIGRSAKRPQYSGARVTLAIRLWCVFLCACGSADAPEPPPAPTPVPQKLDEALASIVATCARCDGAVEVRRKGKPFWEPIAMGGTFRDGDWIRTGDGGTARIRFVSGGHLDLDAKTTLFVEADGGKRGDRVAAVHVAMQSGGASGELDGSDAPIRIRTSDGDVRIAGAGKSQFKLASTTDGAIDVAVDQGELIVRSSTGERRIEAVKRVEVTAPAPDKRLPMILKPKPATVAIGFPQSVSPRIDARFQCMFGLEIPLRWNAVAGATKYRVVVAKDMSFRSVVASQEVAGTQLAFAPKQPGTYVWRVAARDKRGYGEFGFARRIFCN